MSGVADRERVKAAVRELLAGFGLDADTRELADTPGKVADAYAQFFAGIGTDPLSFLSDALPVDGHTGELVVMRDIALRSVCEHHLLPFRGRAHIAYLPGEKLVGLSALPRVVDALAARPQLQERLGEQIADVLVQGLAPAGVLVVLEASHGCVSDRGVMQADAVTVTVASRGSLAEAGQRAEVFALLGVAGQQAEAQQQTIPQAPQSGQ